MPANLPDTIAAASRLIEARELSPLELVNGLLARIEAIDPVINSFITVTAEQAVVQARQAESEISQGRYRGPLHGIPFGVKTFTKPPESARRATPELMQTTCRVATRVSWTSFTMPAPFSWASSQPTSSRTVDLRST